MASPVSKWRKTKRTSLVVLCLFAVVGFAVYFRLFRSEPVTHDAANAVSIAKPIQVPASSTEQTIEGAKVNVQAGEQTNEQVGGHALDPVLELARSALKQIQTEVDDYSGRLIKRERIKGVLGSEVQMDFKIRTRRVVDGKVTRPLSAYLKFNEPKSARGREVIWTEGANGNKLTGHEGAT